MRKWIVFFLTFALFVAISFGSYLYFYRAEFASTALTRLYGVPVKIAKVRLSKSGVKLQNLVVYNPSEYTLQPALSCSSVNIKITPQELLMALLDLRTATIRKLTIVDPLIGIQLPENNWVTILTNLGNALERSTPSRTFNLQKVDIQDMMIQLRNRVKGKSPKKPSAIGHLELIPTTDKMQIPDFVYWVTRLSLLQVSHPDFTSAIEQLPEPSHHPQPLKLS